MSMMGTFIESMVIMWTNVTANNRQRSANNVILVDASILGSPFEITRSFAIQVWEEEGGACVSQGLQSADQSFFSRISELQNVRELPEVKNEWSSPLKESFRPQRAGL